MNITIINGSTFLINRNIINSYIFFIFDTLVHNMAQFILTIKEFYNNKIICM